METQDNIRSDKRFKVLGQFSNEILVKCPHCSGKAKVLSTYPSDTKSVFRCNNCYKPINEKFWHTPVNISAVISNCDYCGATLRSIKKKIDRYKRTIEIECAICRHAKDYSVWLPSPSNYGVTDPFFGLQLWLQYPEDGRIFWAYNYEHLEYLRKYVAAKLREQGIVPKYVLTRQLPNFIKLSKNRDRILKIIDRLQKIDFKPK